MTANYLTTEILLAISTEKLGVAWRNNRIDAMALGRGGRQRRVSAGIDGQGDITGIARLADGAMGVRIELEVKVGKDRLSDKQIAFSRMVRDAGGIYIVCRTLDQTMHDLKKEIYRKEALL